MTKNQTVLATPIMFLSQLKALMKSFIQKKQTSKTPIAELFSKISNKKKSQIKNVTIVRQTFF